MPDCLYAASVPFLRLAAVRRCKSALRCRGSGRRAHRRPGRAGAGLSFCAAAAHCPGKAATCDHHHFLAPTPAEFGIVRHLTHDALVLSQFNGAAIELQAALIINPYHIEQRKDALYRALIMPVSEQGDRCAAYERLSGILMSIAGMAAGCLMLHDCASGSG